MRPCGHVFLAKNLPRTPEDKPPKAVRTPHYGSFGASGQRSAQRLPTLRRGAGRPGVTRYAWPTAPLTAAQPRRTITATAVSASWRTSHRLLTASDTETGMVQRRTIFPPWSRTSSTPKPGINRKENNAYVHSARTIRRAGGQ